MDDNRHHPVDNVEPQVLREDQYLSIVKYFSNGHRAMKALRCINMNFLHVNIHVPLLPETDDPNVIHNKGDTDHDMAHLETTIDMRYHPRQLERENFVETQWVNDKLMQEQHRKRGEIAALTLRELRKRMEAACVNPIQAIMQDWWAHHNIVEQKRKETKKRMKLRFEGIEDVGNSEANKKKDGNEKDPDAVDIDEGASGDGNCADSDSEYSNDNNIYVKTYPGASLKVTFDRCPFTGRRRIRRSDQEHWQYWLDW